MEKSLISVDQGDSVMKPQMGFMQACNHNGFVATNVWILQRFLPVHANVCTLLL